MKTVAGLALLAALALASGAASETYGLKAAKAALSGKSQAVIVGVPAQFFRADRITAPTDSQTAGDWSYYFGEWLGRYREASNVVVIDDREIKQLFKSPALDKTCATVFVRVPPMPWSTTPTASPRPRSTTPAPPGSAPAPPPTPSSACAPLT